MNRGQRLNGLSWFGHVLSRRENLLTRMTDGIRQTMTQKRLPKEGGVGKEKYRKKKKKRK